MSRMLMATAIAVFSLFLIQCGKDKPSAPAIPDPIASFSESGGNVTPATIVFQNTSQNADSYLWRFGDGDSSTITNPTHVYDQHGDYTVMLIAKNSVTGKIASKSQLLSITPGTVSIESIFINSIPFTDDYGVAWDIGSGPDLYPTLVNSTDLIWYSPYYYLDVVPSYLPLEYPLSPSIQFPNWSMSYYVQVWDYDDLSNDDYIGSTYGFTIDNVIHSFGYTTMLDLGSSSGTLSATIVLRWQ